MSILDVIDDSTSKAVKKGEDYISKTKEYYALKVFQQLALMSSFFIKVVIFGSLLILGIIFMAISGANALSELLESSVLGYLTMGLIFLVLNGFIYLGRHVIDKKIIKKLSKNYFEK
tara:strand:- start:18560 stop:18910 length:351 start_codon:yes stop_codon:yes gene_type:complete